MRSKNFELLEMKRLILGDCKLNCVKVENLPTLIQYGKERRTIQFRRDQEKGPGAIPLGQM
jgi:hypothetical protein